MKATPIISDRKECTKCKVVKSLDDFPVHAKSEGRERRHRHWCRPCMAAYLKAWHEKRGGRTVYYRQRDTGVTPEQYAQMVLAQGGVCAICLRDPKGTTKRCDVLNADHDHATGKPRGLLCGHCNRALGLLRDDVEIMQAAIDYIKKYREVM